MANEKKEDARRQETKPEINETVWRRATSSRISWQ